MAEICSDKYALPLYVNIIEHTDTNIDGIVFYKPRVYDITHFQRLQLFHDAIFSIIDKCSTNGICICK